MYGKTKGREDNRERLNVRPTSIRMQEATRRRLKKKAYTFALQTNERAARPKIEN
ncbi:hypothetical protein HMPREF6745_1384 [Prevotella sp. oral taxon 472 str. F0295]|nr:hypothetical protein HMPREF6745_1384 [Prevotella sp. oral taxon 472 str. F0295]